VGPAQGAGHLEHGPPEAAGYADRRF